VLHDKQWNIVDRIAIDPAGLQINEGVHTICLHFRFTGGKDPTVKTEFRMIGAAERIHGQRR
jgi:hypothetical protein